MLLPTNVTGSNSDYLIMWPLKTSGLTTGWLNKSFYRRLSLISRKGKVQAF